MALAKVYFRGSDPFMTYVRYGKSTSAASTIHFTKDRLMYAFERLTTVKVEIHFLDVRKSSLALSSFHSLIIRTHK
jgi:hypothetical protein